MFDGLKDLVEGPRNGDGPAGDDEDGGVVQFVAICQHLDGPKPDEIATAGIIDEQQEASRSIGHSIVSIRSHNEKGRHTWR